ncbi:hypothetical protein H4582DRAFT_976717 [Lactarius indigo]|nr:hypothetical protein H4582DRAFT_976717 [Lactarius indigo]
MRRECRAVIGLNCFIFLDFLQPEGHSMVLKIKGGGVEGVPFYVSFFPPLLLPVSDALTCMSASNTSQNWGQQAAQPNDLYPNDNFWGSMLRPSETHEEFLSNDVYDDQFLGDYNKNLEQVLNRQTYGEPGDAQNLGYPESSATATQPSFLPTPVGLSLGGATNWQSSWENEDVDMDLSRQVNELQLESPTPSTSNLATGLGKKSRKKKEEGGVCSQCNKVFSRKSDARRHEITVHGGEGYICQVCNTPCCRKDALQRHMRDQHQQ